jgi:hypothetical protein
MNLLHLAQERRHTMQLIDAFPLLSLAKHKNNNKKLPNGLS